MPRTRQSRALAKLLSPFLSPADSGYGSSECLTPEGRLSPPADILQTLPFCVDCVDYGFLCDGSGSSENRDSDEERAGICENIPRCASTATSSPKPTSSASSPTVRKSGGKLSSPATPTDGCNPQTPGSLRRLDRYVPSWDPDTPTSHKYRTTNDISELSTPERLLRNSAATPDAFGPIRTLTVPMASDRREITRTEAPLGTALSPFPLDQATRTERRVSHGTVWTVGGVVPSGTAIDDGRGSFVQSGTNARFFPSKLARRKSNTQEEHKKHQGRLANALDIDQTAKVFEFHCTPSSSSTVKSWRRDMRDLLRKKITTWNGTEWVNEARPPTPTRNISSLPFRVLDAPGLRDDYYCSALAYSPTLHMLVVGLGTLLYSWSESYGVKLLNASAGPDWLTSVSFSSVQGNKAILAFSRSSGILGLMSLDGELPRFEVKHQSPINCISWRPTCTRRLSKHPHHPPREVETEDLLVGNEQGSIFYYIVEWANVWEVARDNWPGALTLVANISAHTQQICALVWSPNSQMFASGANDNLCCLFEVDQILKPARPQSSSVSTIRRRGRRSSEESVDAPAYAAPAAPHILEVHEDGTTFREVRTSSSSVRQFGRRSALHRWVHSAAVKAIAFCPWQDGLVATGGGSNDMCIHFFHTRTGTALATIAVAAQVTSLIWSVTRREIAATFGYAQPEHPYRIAVFSWPSCKQVGAVRSTPGQYHDRSEDEAIGRTAQEGCLVVSASDKSVKFHEVWHADGHTTVGVPGMLGGSDILESLEGIHKDGDIIR